MNKQIIDLLTEELFQEKISSKYSLQDKLLSKTFEIMEFYEKMW